MTSLSVVIPTLGRSSLKSQLLSLMPQLGSEDEVLVIADSRGDVDTAEEIFWNFSKQDLSKQPCMFFFETNNKSSSMGNEQRNLGIRQATNDFIWCIDDDDICPDNAVEIIRKALSLAAVPCLHIFQMLFHGSVIWTHNRIEPGNFGTASLVFKNHSSFPLYQVPHLSYCTDANWVTSVVAAGIPVAWHEGIIQIVPVSSSYESSL